MNLYDFNKAAMATMPELTKEEVRHNLKEAINNIPNIQRCNYLMFMCYELRDFTIFSTKTDKRNLVYADIADFAMERGKVIGVDWNDETKGIEIWVKSNNIVKMAVDDPQDVNMYLLFDYTQGVIEPNG